ncbi:MAG TPA: hypothetical protein VGN93_02615 [Shinella sp.]|jgi:hypothetical protein|uniref:hypothetical protein n=1 Tax=Shinella sp. TaxID=1870904 RepID=UPI002E0EB29B|nr:hypothetical protein [Shinella sp.]
MQDGKWRKGSTAGIDPHIAARLEKAIYALRAGCLDSATLDGLLADLDRLPPDMAQQVARLSASVFRYRLPSDPEPTLLGRLLAIRKNRPEKPSPAVPPGRSAWLRMCHPDGFVRELALHELADAPASALRLALLLMRFDDWAAPVAAAGRAAFTRLAPSIPLSAAQGIAPLIADHHVKRRGRMDLAAPVIDLLTREESWPALLCWLTASTDNTVAAVMRLLLLSDRLDRALAQLLTARHYLVRALAARTLISGHAEIVAGRTKKTEATFAGRQSSDVPALVTRPITIAPDVAATLRQAAQDRTTTVRKIAADGLIANRDRLGDLDALLALFDKEPNGAIRERIDFIRRRRVSP